MSSKTVSFIFNAKLSEMKNLNLIQNKVIDYDEAFMEYILHSYPVFTECFDLKKTAAP